MAFRFKNSSCVTIGTFNIYVVQPGLLHEIGAIPLADNERLGFETDLSQPGFRFEFPAQGVKCSVRPDRFTVESSNREVDCGLVMASVLQALQYTPLSAIGINAVFVTADPEEINDLYERYFEALPGLDGQGVRQRTLHSAIMLGEEIFNLQIAFRLEAGETELSLNVHRQLRGKRVRKSEAARQLAARFLELRNQAEALAPRVFPGVGIWNHAPNND